MAPHVARGLQNVLVDLGEREEDRPDAQDHVELDEGHGVAELGIQQHRGRLLDDPHLHEEVVQQTAAPEHRQPRDGTDEVARPERHHAHQEQRHLPLERVDVHGEEVGDRVPQQQAEEHHREGEPERRPQRLDEDAGLEEFPLLRVEEPFGDEVLVVVLNRRVRRHPVAGGRPEAEHDDARERHHQEQDEPRHSGRDEPPDREPAFPAHPDALRLDDLRRRGRLGADQAPMANLDGSLHSGCSGPARSALDEERLGPGLRGPAHPLSTACGAMSVSAPVPPDRTGAVRSAGAAQSYRSSHGR